MACGIIGLNKATLAVYLFGSLLQAAESPAYKSLVADFSSSEDRDRAYSLSYLGLNLGLVLAPTLGGFLIKDHIGLMFILSGAFEFLSIVIFDIFVKDTGAIRDTGNKYESDSESGSVIKVLRDGKVLIPFIIIFSFSMFVYKMYGYLMPLSLTEAHGETGSVYYGTISSLNCITVLVFTAVITSAFGKKTTVFKMISGNIFEIAGLLIFFLALGTPWLYYIAIVIFTLGEILNTTTTSPHLTKRIPVNYRGRIMAISSVASNITASLGKYAIGKIYDGISPDAAWIAVFAVGVFTVIGYAVMGKTDKKVYPGLYSQDK